VPGIRPGKSERSTSTLFARITLAGAIYLAPLAILAELPDRGFRASRRFPFIGEWLDAALPNFNHRRV